MSPRSARQSFLGAQSDAIFARTRVGVVGLGGGGSHIVQQLAHVGFVSYALYDPDVAEESNLNRLIGATAQDVENCLPKVILAERMIRGLVPAASIQKHQTKWADEPDDLRACDIIFGCVDMFAARQQLEAFCRRFLIPYIDIGMDVHKPVGGEPPRMAGQVIMSMPGGPCMFCMNFLTQKTLGEEAALYGAAGDRPQVVWPNGVLASTAVGLAVNMLTDWSESRKSLIYLQYTGNDGLVQPHPMLRHLPANCEHYPLSQVGDSRGKQLR